MRTAQTRPRLQAVDLTPEGFYFGTVPGGKTVCMWEYCFKRERKNEAPHYMFEDCSQDDDKPQLVGFTAREVSEFLHRV